MMGKKLFLAFSPCLLPDTKDFRACYKLFVVALAVGSLDFSTTNHPVDGSF